MQRGGQSLQGSLHALIYGPAQACEEATWGRGRVTCGEWRGESPAPSQGPGKRLSPEPQWVLKFKDTGRSRQEGLASVMGQNAALGPPQKLKNRT